MIMIMITNSSISNTEVVFARVLKGPVVPLLHWAAFQIFASRSQKPGLPADLLGISIKAVDDGAVVGITYEEAMRQAQERLAP